MSTPEIHHLFHAGIADHSFSSDHTTLAVTRDSTIDLYARSGNTYTHRDTLLGHDKLVTGVDIAPRSGKIVTCSQDRNAYVWEQSNGTWKPTLVLLRINRAATSVRWSPSEDKFAVGSGARVAAVCYFESENDWWVSKHLKKPLRSTVTCVAWHPNSVLLGVGSTDGHARVLSAFVKGVDERPAPSAWGERLPFNTVCGEFLNQTAGWVRGVGFSPSGDAMAFCGQDSTVTVVYPGGEGEAPRSVVSVNAVGLPWADLLWVGEGEIVCAGYDCAPYLLRGDASGWSVSHSLDSTAASKGAQPSGEESALNMFKQMDLKGTSRRDDTKLKSVHQNTITKVRSYEVDGQGNVSRISTSGVDGRVVVWDL
ncbi:ARP2/3 actin-organizing complex subunit Sop2 [Zalaria obscura]|uniref:ARP2/3 actin-organizing complex subunit Sop2 n=1 Tax=Zalaria obscura TaxID=2024903 RepID=A0ACC3SBT2_9PEZI